MLLPKWKKKERKKGRFQTPHIGGKLKVHSCRSVRGTWRSDDQCICSDTLPWTEFCILDQQRLHMASRRIQIQEDNFFFIYLYCKTFLVYIVRSHVNQQYSLWYMLSEMRDFLSKALERGRLTLPSNYSPFYVTFGLHWPLLIEQNRQKMFGCAQSLKGCDRTTVHQIWKCLQIHWPSNLYKFPPDFQLKAKFVLHTGF